MTTNRGRSKRGANDACNAERIVDELDVLIAGWLCTSCKAAEKAAEGGQQ
jgi:hypothetical protein